MHAGVGGSTRFNLDLRLFASDRGTNQPTVSVYFQELLPGHLYASPYLLDLLSSVFSSLFFFLISDKSSYFSPEEFFFSSSPGFFSLSLSLSRRLEDEKIKLPQS